jgi:hypothetical protein
MSGAVLDCSLRSLRIAQEAAYFVVTCRRKACRLAPPQHSGRDPLVEAQTRLARRCEKKGAGLWLIALISTPIQ